MDLRPIGILDSGVGGLSVAREIRRLLPREDLIYFADQANCPYGPKSIEEIQALALAAARQLDQHAVKLIVVACNTASTAALGTLRETYPQPFVGIVPAIKPASQTTRTGKVGVLATRATLGAAAFERLIAQFGSGVVVLRQACPEFVEAVERGDLDSPATEALVRQKVEPLAQAGIDRLVLGCTHFAFLRPAIARVAGPAIQIIDAAGAVAQQTARVLAQRDLLSPNPLPGRLTLRTSGDAATFAALAARLLGWESSP